MTDHSLVTVIIPVYKVEDYLDFCVQSVVNQSYKNLEILLVDDGSPDGCPQICDEWATRDSRIKVFHKANGGLASARNMALDHMQGDFVTFVDSDDWLSPNAVETMLSYLIEFHADISEVGAVVEYDDGTQEPYQFDFGLQTKLYDSDEALRKFLYHDGLASAAWGKLYNASFFKPPVSLRFPDGLNSEDYYLLSHLFNVMEKGIYVQLKPRLYHYRQRAESICTTTSIDTHTVDKIAIADICVQYLRSQRYENEKALRYFQMEGRYDVLYSLLVKQADSRLIRRYAKELRKSAKPVYTDSSVSLSRKIKIALLSTFPHAYYAMQKVR